MMVLALEVALTRAFSVLLRFHYVFLAVSLATCGLGLGGVIDYALRKANGRPVLGVSALAAALLAPAGIILLFASPISAYLTSLWVLSACCLPGFMAAGVFLSRAFSVWGRHSGIVYYADLTGAAIAAAGVIVALQLGGAVNAALGCAALGAFAAALSWRRLWFASLACLVCATLFFSALGNSKARVVDLPALPLAGDPLAKPLYQELGDPSSGARLLLSDWNAFARTDVVVYATPDGHVPKDSDLYLYTDGEVPTNIVPYHGSLEELAKRYRDFIGLYAFRMVMPQKVMLIGPGGGLDIWLALIVGATEIRGAEVNPSIPRIVRRFRNYGGPVYDFANVDIAVAEGRSYLRRETDKYDFIYMALTKTATTATTSMALIESYVHTVEAFRDYERHLTDDGALAFVCQETPLLIREMATALRAMELEGASRKEAVSRIAMVSVPEERFGAGPYRHLLLVFCKPLNVGRSREMAEQAVASDLVPVFFPGVYEPQPFGSLWDAGRSIEELLAAWNRQWTGGVGLNLTPCTDDQPFVVDLTWGVPLPLKRFLECTGVLCVVLVVLAGTLGVRRQAETAGLETALWPLYFAGLGVGFMLVEVVLIQMFTLYLGYPVLSLAAVLFGILLGAGLGSLLSQRAEARHGAQVVTMAVAGLVVLALAARLGGPAVFSATLGWNVRLRSLVTLAMVVPLGLVMGVPFPTGLRMVVDHRGKPLVPWMWAVNGVTSVVGSAAAMACAKLIGFLGTLNVGLLVYVVAVVILLGLSWLCHKESGDSIG